MSKLAPCATCHQLNRPECQLGSTKEEKHNERNTFRFINSRRSIGGRRPSAPSKGSSRMSIRSMFTVAPKAMANPAFQETVGGDWPASFALPPAFLSNLDSKLVETAVNSTGSRSTMCRALILTCEDLTLGHNHIDKLNAPQPVVIWGAKSGCEYWHYHIRLEQFLC